MSIRVHLLAPPNVQTTREYCLDGFCMATIRFAKLLKKLGYYVILYASEENEAPCDEFVTCVTKAEQQPLLDKIPYQYAGASGRTWPLWNLVNVRMTMEIGKRKQPRDFICTIGGTAQEPIANAHPEMMCVEYSIGYVASFAKYRVYESHCWRSLTHGKQNTIDGRFFDTVIPLFFDPSEFKFRTKSERDPFALFVGRITPKKGIEIACRAAQAAGMTLKVAGHGDPSLVRHGAEYIGTPTHDERNELMSRASVLICPTTYIEPFGSVAIEAQLAGTPVVSTNFGGFVETVEHGKTGFRCDFLGEFITAVKEAPLLDNAYIRQRAIDKYSIAAVAPLYHSYFQRLLLLWENGWETPTVPS